MKTLRLVLTALALAPAGLRAAEPAVTASAPLPPTEITAQKLEMWSNEAGTEERAIFTGNVAVTGNEIKLTCDRLDITAERLGDKTATIGTFEKFKSLVAVGKVHIVQGDREAFCGRAEVYPREDKIVLYEKPVVVDNAGPYTYTGDYLEMWRGERRVTGANVKLTGPALKSLSYDKDSPLPSLPAPAATEPPPAAKPAAAPATPAKPAKK